MLFRLSAFVSARTGVSGYTVLSEKGSRDERRKSLYSKLKGGWLGDGLAHFA